MMTISSVIAVALYAASDVITMRMMWLTVLMLPAQIAGLWIGAKYFAMASEEGYRRISLSVLLAIGIATMVV